MGWLSMTSAGMAGHPNPKAYLDDQFTYSRALDGGGTRGMRVIESAFVGNRVWCDRAEVRLQPAQQPHHFQVASCLCRQAPARPDPVEIAVKVQLQ